MKRAFAFLFPAFRGHGECRGLVLDGGTIVDGYGMRDPGRHRRDRERPHSRGRWRGSGRDPGGRGSRLDRGHDRAAGPMGHAGRADASRPRRYGTLERNLRPARRARRDADRGAAAPAGGSDGARDVAEPLEARCTYGGRVTSGYRGPISLFRVPRFASLRGGTRVPGKSAAQTPDRKSSGSERGRTTSARGHE